MSACTCARAGSLTRADASCGSAEQRVVARKRAAATAARRAHWRRTAHGTRAGGSRSACIVADMPSPARKAGARVSTTVELRGCSRSAGGAPAAPRARHRAFPAPFPLNAAHASAPSRALRVRATHPSLWLCSCTLRLLTPRAPQRCRCFARPRLARGRGVGAERAPALRAHVLRHRPRRQAAGKPVRASRRMAGALERAPCASRPHAPRQLGGRRAMPRPGPALGSPARSHPTCTLRLRRFCRPRRTLTRLFRARSSRRGAQATSRSASRATTAQAASAPAPAAASVR